MGEPIPRRAFLKTVPAAAYALTAAVQASKSTPSPRAPAAVPPARAGAAIRLETFDYQGVTLGPGRWKQQVDEAKAFYLGISNDDILCGFRKAAGLAAPGQPLGGWCGVNSNTVFGQWLSGLARLWRATGDQALQDKAIDLFGGWASTVKPNGDCGMDHYAFDKLICGLVDLELYLGPFVELGPHPITRDIAPLRARVIAYADKTFARAAAPMADITDNHAYYGKPQEWYTLGENLLRAYRLTGDESTRRFAEEWFYHAYWNTFRSSSSPADAHGVHAYSHVNTFSSAAMAYEVTGDESYLAIVKNAYDYLAHFQCYATGGYGPNERFMKTDGSLGRALDTRSDTFEAVCGSYAGFKLARYLMRFTGEARYGDWIERLFYNGVGAALHVTDHVRNFYYADYRVGGGMKVYNWDTCTCCSGTYIQNMAEYHNLIYFKDADSLYVNLYVPSAVAWVRPSSIVRVAQTTNYPDGETTTLSIEVIDPAGRAGRATAAPEEFALRFRVPSWTTTLSASVNGAPAAIDGAPGELATIRRAWKTGDTVEVRIPLTLRMEPVDRWHPNRVAVVRGPVVLVLEGAYHDPNFRLPMADGDLPSWLVPETGGAPASGVWSTAVPAPAFPATIFRVVPPDKSAVRLRFRPFYEPGENYPYFMYFDRDKLPWRLW
jgi:hypothetical protein